MLDNNIVPVVILLALGLFALTIVVIGLRGRVRDLERRK